MRRGAKCIVCGAPATAAIMSIPYCHDGPTPTHYEVACLDAADDRPTSEWLTDLRTRFTIEDP